MLLKVGSVPITSDFIEEKQIEQSFQPTEFNQFRLQHFQNIISKSTQTVVLPRVDKSSQTINHVNLTRSTPITIKQGHDHESSFSTVTTISERSSNLEEYFPSFSSDSEAVTKYPICQTTISIMKARPKHYMGVNKNCLHLIEVLMKKTLLSEEKIMLTLRKIRLNEEFLTLGDLFDIDRRTAGKYFKESVRPIANCLKKFLKYAKVKSIKRNLPISFRRNYKHVGFILDCFETQIERPSLPKKQAKSYSKYKCCNTLKNLLAVTPDAPICYVVADQATK